jgi:hypothetical protein
MAIDEGFGWTPAACTLPTAERPLRLIDFDRFLASVQRFDRPRPTRLDLTIPRAAETAGRRLAERESACCSFFTFEFEPAAQDVMIRIGVPADQVEVLDALQARVARRIVRR